MNLIRVLLADEHILPREATRQLLEREGDLEVVAETGDGREAIEWARRLQPHVAIIDLRLPVMNGIETARGIRDASPDTTVLILSAYDGDDCAAAILDALHEAGAADYLAKNVRGHVLVDTVRRLADSTERTDGTAVRRHARSHSVALPPRLNGRSAAERLA
jgi:DNA-binding NarL/FixJ family response regulator